MSVVLFLWWNNDKVVAQEQYVSWTFQITYGGGALSSSSSCKHTEHMPLMLSIIITKENQLFIFNTPFLHADRWTQVNEFPKLFSSRDRDTQMLLQNYGVNFLVTVDADMRST